MIKRHLLAFALALCVVPAIAQQGPKPVPADAATRKAVIAELSSQLKANYVFPDVADKLATALAAKEASGGYAQATDSKAFADALSKDLRTLGNDSHFAVGYDPEFRPAPANGVPDAASLEAMHQEISSRGFGIDSARRLPGNVGYLELRGFGPTAMVGPAISGAMTMLSGTDALILDLRRNGGGEPDTVAYLMSHFFAQGDDRHLNDLYFRNGDKTRQYWTIPSVGPRYTRPVYVLTSGRTFSGGEECAYDFQTQKRAKIVGEKTGGGANPGDGYAHRQGLCRVHPEWPRDQPDHQDQLGARGGDAGHRRARRRRTEGGACGDPPRAHRGVEGSGREGVPAGQPGGRRSGQGRRAGVHEALTRLG